jgi:hypothetical protein
VNQEGGTRREGEGEREQQDRLAELASRANPITPEEAIFNSISQHWQKAAGAIVVLFLAWWVYTEYELRIAQREGDASHQFSEILKSVAVLSSPPPAPDATPDPQAVENQDKARKGIEDTFELLKKTGAGTKYNKLAPLVLGVTAFADKDLDKALSYLQPKPLSSRAKVTDADALINELIMSVRARVLLEKDPQRGKDALIELAKNANIVSTEALLSLALIAKNQAELDEVKKLAEELLKRQPELRDTVLSELSPFGINLT